MSNAFHSNDFGDLVVLVEEERTDRVEAIDNGERVDERVNC